MIHIAEQFQSCSSGRDRHGLVEVEVDAAACCGRDDDNGGGDDGGAELGPAVVNLSFGLELFPNQLPSQVLLAAMDNHYLQVAMQKN
jgi:hypothetical protein